MGYKVVTIDGYSMSPTLKHMQSCLFEMTFRGHGVETGDIISFVPPQRNEASKSSQVCKRVVAVAGDLVYATGGVLYVNKEPSKYQGYGKTPNIQPTQVPRGYVFALGDNRASSFDSSYYGAVKRSKIRSRFLRKLKSKEVRLNKKQTMYKPRDFKSCYDMCLKEIYKKWGIH